LLENEKKKTSKPDVVLPQPRFLVLLLVILLAILIAILLVPLLVLPLVLLVLPLVLLVLGSWANRQGTAGCLLHAILIAILLVPLLVLPLVLLVLGSWANRQGAAGCLLHGKHLVRTEQWFAFPGLDSQRVVWLLTSGSSP
jgi:hypothetical protein